MRSYGIENSITINSFNYTPIKCTRFTSKLDPLFNWPRYCVLCHLFCLLYISVCAYLRREKKSGRDFVQMKTHTHASKNNFSLILCAHIHNATPYNKRSVTEFNERIEKQLRLNSYKLLQMKISKRKKWTLLHTAWLYIQSTIYWLEKWKLEIEILYRRKWLRTSLKFNMRREECNVH